MREAATWSECCSNGYVLGGYGLTPANQHHAASDVAAAIHEAAEREDVRHRAKRVFSACGMELRRVLQPVRRVGEIIAAEHPIGWPAHYVRHAPRCARTRQR